MKRLNPRSQRRTGGNRWTLEATAGHRKLANGTARIPPLIRPVIRPAGTETELSRYSCQQMLIAYVQSEMNSNYSISLNVTLSGETDAAVDAEGLTAYTDELYLSEEELLSYLEQAMQAVYPAAEAE